MNLNVYQLRLLSLWRNGHTLADMAISLQRNANTVASDVRKLRKALGVEAVPNRQRAARVATCWALKAADGALYVYPKGTAMPPLPRPPSARVRVRVTVLP